MQKKPKLIPLDTSGIYYSDVIDNSKNFKELAGKNYYTISKYKGHLKPNVEKIFSTDEQKMKAFNYVKSYRSRRRMNDFNGTMSSFLDNTGTSFNQTVITARNNRGMLTLNDLKTSNDESTMAHNESNNNTVITAIKNVEIDNNTDSNSGKKLKSKRNMKNKRAKVFLTDEEIDNKELLEISNFGFEVDLSMRKCTIERESTKESTSNMTNESFTSENVEGFSFTPKKENKNLIFESNKNGVWNDGFSLICEKKKENFTGYIIMEMNNGKEVQSFKCKKNSNVNFMNKEFEKGNIQIKQSLLQFVNPYKKEDIKEEKKKIKEEKAQTEIETKEIGANTEKKKILNEISANSFELLGIPVKTITIENNDTIIENVIEELPKKKVFKSKRPNRGRIAKVVEQQQEEKTKMTNSYFEIINTKKVIENTITKINEICFNPKPMKKVLLKKAITIEESSPISICIPSSDKPQRKLKSAPRKKNPIKQSSPISFIIPSIIEKPRQIQTTPKNNNILSQTLPISLSIPSKQPKSLPKHKISLSKSPHMALSFLSVIKPKKQFKSSCTNTNKSKLITEGTNTITKRPKYKINRTTFEYPHTPSIIECTAEAVSSLSFLSTPPINTNKSFPHNYTTSILSTIVFVTMLILISYVYNRRI